MEEEKENRGFVDIIVDGLDSIAKRILENISASFSKEFEKISHNFEERLVQIEQKILLMIFSFAIIGISMIFIAFALFFYLREYLGWSNSASFLTIGIIMLAAGLLLKFRDRRGGRNENSSA